MHALSFAAGATLIAALQHTNDTTGVVLFVASCAFTACAALVDFHTRRK